MAEAHPLLQSGKTIKSINYQISANCSRLQNKVSGKSKRVWLFDLVSFHFNLSQCLRLSVLSRIETYQVTFAFYFKTAPPQLKNLDFLKRCLSNCPSQGLTVLLQHQSFPVLLKPRLTVAFSHFFHSVQRDLNIPEKIKIGFHQNAEDLETAVFLRQT